MECRETGSSLLELKVPPDQISGTYQIIWGNGTTDINPSNGPLDPYKNVTFIDATKLPVLDEDNNPVLDPGDYVGDPNMGQPLFAARLALDPNTTYAIKDASGNQINCPITGAPLFGGDPALTVTAATLESGTLLEAGKVYSVLTRMTIASGANFVTPSSLDITPTQVVADMQDTIVEMLDKELSEVEDAVIDAVEEAVADAMEIPVGLIVDAAGKVDLAAEKMEDLEEDLVGGVQSILAAGVTLTSVVEQTSADMTNMVEAFDATSTRLATAATAVEVVSRQFAPELLLPPTVRIGEELNIRYSSFTGLTPVVKVAAHDGKIIVSYVPMTESSDQPGLYEYLIPKIDGKVFVADKPMMVTVSEPVTANFEAGSVQVVSTSLDTVAGLVAASMGIRDKVNKTFDAVQGMTGAFGEGSVIHEALTSIDVSIEGVLEEVSSGADATEATLQRVADTVDSVDGTLLAFLEEEGYDTPTFRKLLEKGLEESVTMRAIRNKATDIYRTTRILRGIADAGLTGDYNPFVTVVFK